MQPLKCERIESLKKLTVSPKVEAIQLKVVDLKCPYDDGVARKHSR